MSKFFGRLYFFTKLSTSIILLIIIIIFIYLFSKSYQNQKKIKEDNLKVYDALINELNSNNSKIEELVKKIKKFEGNLNDINDKIEVKNNDEIKKNIENLETEIQNITNNFNNKKNNSNSIESINNKEILNEYLNKIFYNFKNGIMYDNLIIETLKINNNDQVETYLRELLSISENNILSYEQLKDQFNDISNIYLKDYFIDENEDSFLVRYFLKFFSLKPSSKIKSNNADFKTLSNVLENLENDNVENALNEIVKINNNKIFFTNWISDANNYNRVEKLIKSISKEINK